MDEKRNFVRVKGLHDIQFRIKGQGGALLRVGVKNISLQGISILRTTAMPEGTVLEMILDLAGQGGPVPISGTVMWQMPDGSGMFSTGIQFQSYDTVTREQLSKFITACARRVEENREFVRCAVTMPVFHCRAGEKERAAQSVDISCGGMKMIVNEPLMLGMRLNVTLKLPDGLAAVTCAAEVAWVQPGDTAIRRVGVRFLDLAKADSDRIWQYVSQHCTDGGREEI